VSMLSACTHWRTEEMAPNQVVVETAAWGMLPAPIPAEPRARDSSSVTARPLTSRRTRPYLWQGCSSFQGANCGRQEADVAFDNQSRNSRANDSHLDRSRMAWREPDRHCRVVGSRDHHGIPHGSDGRGDCET
jgi:hypothetical protein